MIVVYLVELSKSMNKVIDKVVSQSLRLIKDDVTGARDGLRRREEGPWERRGSTGPTGSGGAAGRARWKTRSRLKNLCHRSSKKVISRKAINKLFWGNTLRNNVSKRSKHFKEKKINSILDDKGWSKIITKSEVHVNCIIHTIFNF